MLFFLPDIITLREENSYFKGDRTTIRIPTALGTVHSAWSTYLCAVHSANVQHTGNVKDGYQSQTFNTTDSKKAS